jgi:hypothetical protein
VNALRIGETAPDFRALLGTDGKKYSLASFADFPTLVLIASCNHCPYVQAYEDRMITVQRDYMGRGVGFVAVNPNYEGRLATNVSTTATTVTTVSGKKYR